MQDELCNSPIVSLIQGPEGQEAMRGQVFPEAWGLEVGVSTSGEDKASCRMPGRTLETVIQRGQNQRGDRPLSHVPSCYPAMYMAVRIVLCWAGTMHSGVVKSDSLGVRLLGFKDQPTILKPWTNYLPSLCLSFLTYKMGVITELGQSVVESVKSTKAFYSEQCLM